MEERARLKALEALFDPTTTAALESTGIASGWRCQEVGGGAGSVARWLSEQVGPAGHVAATDVQAGFLDELGLTPMEHDSGGGSKLASNTRLVPEEAPDDFDRLDLQGRCRR